MKKQSDLINSKRLLYKEDRELLEKCTFKDALNDIKYGVGDFKIVHDAALEIRDRDGGTITDALKHASIVYWSMMKGEQNGN